MSLQRGQCLINLCRSVAPAHDRKAVPASGAPVRFRRHAATVVRTGARAERRDASIPTCSCHCGKRCRYTAPAIDSARPNRAPAAATRSRDRPPPAARSSLPARSANDTTGYAQVLAWILDHAPEPRLIVSIEGTRSYGIGLAQTRIRIDDPKNRPCDSSPHTAQASREGVAGGAFGAGDVNRHALLTHQGMYRARIASAAITPRVAGQSIDTALWAPTRSPPKTTRCRRSSSATPRRSRRTHADQPERGGHRIRVVDVDPSATVIGASLFADGYTGRARMIIDGDHGDLLGFTFVGPGVEELIHSATIAVASQIPWPGSGTPSPASPQSAKSGCAYSRPTAAEDGDRGLRRGRPLPWPQPLDVAYSPTNRNSACHGPSTWTTSQ